MMHWWASRSDEYCSAGNTSARPPCDGARNCPKSNGSVDLLDISCATASTRPETLGGVCEKSLFHIFEVSEPMNIAGQNHCQLKGFNDGYLCSETDQQGAGRTNPADPQQRRWSDRTTCPNHSTVPPKVQKLHSLPKNGIFPFTPYSKSFIALTSRGLPAWSTSPGRDGRPKQPISMSKS